MFVVKQSTSGGIIFKVRVQPRSDRDRIAGLLGDAVKLRLTAPPVDGEANQACRRFFAKMLKVPLSNVEIETGRASRDKTVKVIGISAEEAGEVILSAAMTI